MSRFPARLTVALVAATLLAGAATTRQREDASSDRERYWYYAKPAVSSFSTAGRINGWKPLGRNELVVWTRFDEAYILRVSPGCLGMDIAFGIRIESRVPGTVSSGFDSVGVGRDSCRILEIHPIDYKLMKQEERELMEDAKKDKETGKDKDTEKEKDQDTVKDQD